MDRVGFASRSVASSSAMVIGGGQPTPPIQDDDWRTRMYEERATVRCSECMEGLIGLVAVEPLLITGACRVCGVVLRMRVGTATIERRLVPHGA